MSSDANLFIRCSFVSQSKIQLYSISIHDQVLKFSSCSLKHSTSSFKALLVDFPTIQSAQCQFLNRFRQSWHQQDQSVLSCLFYLFEFRFQSILQLMGKLLFEITDSTSHHFSRFGVMVSYPAEVMFTGLSDLIHLYIY